jgi:class 3 adenylate cyclase/tetratricopeptide (TPR) repeat protein
VSDTTCPACGAPVDQADRFCGACGTELVVPCETCSATWPLAQRFCGACGAALGDTAPQGVEERKVVTALFADLVASTELAARLDPEELNAVVGPFLRAMSEEIARFGGTIEKYAGDAVIAVFGSPVAHEDDPERAVRAGLAMQARLDAMGDELAALAGRQIEMRIGIETGEIVAAVGREAEGLITGGTLHVAARLQSAASPGAVVVGERAWRDTRDTVEYRPHGDMALRGLEGPSQVWLATGIRATRREELAASVPLVGRESELGLLELLLTRTVRDRRAQLITVVGPAGIGKSRLAAEFAGAARDRHPELRVVVGNCLAYGDGLAFWPLAEIVKANAGILDSDPADEIMAKATAHLDAALGVTSDAVDAQRAILACIGFATDDAGTADANMARRRLVRGWKTYLDALAGNGALLVVLEDIHWADRGLLDLLDELPTALGSATTVLCLTRPDLIEQRPGWGGGLGDRTTVVVPPLTIDESAVLTQLLLGAEAPRGLLDAVQRRSEGNPFFASELLRMLTEDGSLARRDGRWEIDGALPDALPDTVQGVIAARIDRLPAAEKQAVQEAAVVGRTFWAGAVTRLGADASVLDTLIDRGLVVERPSSAIAGERELAFIHVLTRDVAYAGLPRARRLHAHAAAGRWVEEVTQGREDEFAEILAHHFGLADDASRAARYAATAGDRSRELFAADDAVRWYDRGLEAAVSLPDTERDAIESRLRLGRAHTYEQVGRFKDAEVDVEHALALARRARDPTLTAQALTARNHVLWLEDRYEEIIDPSEAIDAARAAGEPGLVAHVLYASGAASYGLGRWSDAIALHEQALEEAVASGGRLAEAYALHGLSETYASAGPYSAAIAFGDRGSALMRELGHRALLYENEYIRSLALVLAGRIDEAREAVQVAIDGARAIGDRRNLAYALAASSMALVPRLELELALAHTTEAVTLAQELSVPRLELVARVWRATVNIETGDIASAASDAAEAHNRFGERTTFFAGQLLAVTAWGLLEQGKVEHARSTFARARAVGGRGTLDGLEAGLLELLAWCEAGDATAVRDAGAWLRRQAGEEAIAMIGWADLAEAVAAGLEGADPSEPARSVLVAAERTGDLRLAGRARELLS